MLQTISCLKYWDREKSPLQVNKIYSSPRYYTRSSRRWINSESSISPSTVASADSSRINYKNVIHVLFETSVNWMKSWGCYLGKQLQIRRKNQNIRSYWKLCFAHTCSINWNAIPRELRTVTARKFLRNFHDIPDNYLLWVIRWSHNLETRSLPPGLLLFIILSVKWIKWNMNYLETSSEARDLSTSTEVSPIVTPFTTNVDGFG